MTSTPHTHNWFIFVTPNGPWTLDIEPFYVYCHGLHFQYLSLSSLSDGNSFCTIQILKVRSEPNIFLLLCHHHILPKSLLLLCTSFWFLSILILDSMLLIWQFNLCLQIWSSCVCALLLISSTLSPSIPFYLLCQFIKYLFSVLSSPPPNIYF